MVVAIVDDWPRGFDFFPCRRSARFQCLQAPDGVLMLVFLHLRFLLLFFLFFPFPPR